METSKSNNFDSAQKSERTEKISDIIKDTENSLFNRREVKIIIEAQSNPSFPQASQMLAEKLKAAEENTIVKEIQGKFGRGTFLISAFIYKSKEDREKFEPKKKEKKAAAA